MSRIPETHTYMMVGDCRIQADVFLPDAPCSRVPLLVYVHGGCLMYGSRKNINPRQLELYLGAGYAVISIDYRLAPETKLPGIIEDLEDAFRWVHEEAPRFLPIDTNRVAVIGHSAGGYLTLMAGCRVRPRPKALVSFYGYGDLVGDWYSKPDPFYCRQPAVSDEASGRAINGPTISEPYEGRGKDQFYLYCRQRGLWPREVGGRDPEEHPGFFTPYCPVWNIDDAYPPTLLLHGDQDTDVPYEQSVLMAEELAARGIENDLITMAGQGHCFDGDMDAPAVKDAFATVLAFLEKHLGA
jgi:acetyl esterase/lipase